MINFRNQIIAIVLLSVFVLFKTNGQVTDIKFERLGIKDGLSQSTVRSIIQDKNGLMWFGTADGLNKYDGYSFTVYKSEVDNPFSLSISDPYLLFEDKSGLIWIGSNSTGLGIFYPKNERFYHISQTKENKLTNSSITAITQDNIGNIWVSTRKGLNKLLATPKEIIGIIENANSPELTEIKFKPYSKENNKFNNEYNEKIWDICVDGKYIWMGTDKGLLRLNTDNETVKQYVKDKNVPESLRGTTIWDIYLDEENTLWVASLSGGLNKYIRETETFEHITDSTHNLASNTVYNIFEDSYGGFWVGTYNGLSRYDKELSRFENYRHNPNNLTSLSSNIIWSITEDDGGVLWIGTGDGINKYDLNRKKFFHFRNNPEDENTLINNYLWNFIEDDHNKDVLWIGTSGGLDKFNFKTKKFKHYTASQSVKNWLENKNVWALANGKNNTLWLGTWGGGLYKMDKKTEKFTNYKTIEADSTTISHDFVRALYTDSENTLWVGTLIGLCRYDEQKDEFVRYFVEKGNPNSLSDNFINCIYEDSDNDLWLGTKRGGLCKYDRQTGDFTTYKNEANNDESLSHNTVRAIVEDNNKNLWVGTSKGLCRFNKATGNFKIYLKQHGLPNDVIYSIQVDDSNNLWMSTNNGIAKFNIENETFDNYDVSDGLQSNEFNGGAGYRDSKGRLYFGGINGFNMFYPDSIKQNQYKPPIVITDMQILNKPVPVGEWKEGRTVLEKSIINTSKIILTHKDYVFTFGFSALHYSRPENNRYAYKMEGFDNEWNETSSKRRFATYTNLDQGKYIFKVKGTNADGVWTEEPVEIQITILPPFWETWWFRTIVIILLFASVFWWISERIKRVERQKKILEKQVQERTAEVVQQKEEILAQKEEIEANRDEIEKSYKNVKLLSEIGQEITGTFSVEKIIETDYANINTLMDATAFSIGIFNPTENTIDFPSTIEKGDKLPPYKHSLNDENRLSVWCFKKQKEVVINDFRKEYSKYINVKKAPSAGESPLSIIYLPLVVKDKKVGVITIQSFEPDAYHVNHVDIMRNLAVYTAIALDNASAYDAIEQRNNEIQQIAEELATQAEALLESNTALEKEREHTMGSIRYALTIQKAILPIKELIDKNFDSFIIYRPKDIVSGDFYWYTENKSMIFVGVIDCTGHGVPGAFMSMIGNRVLNEIVNQKNVTSPAEILEQMDAAIRKALQQEHTENDDGMDVCLCRIEKNNGSHELCFAGAKRPLYYTKNGIDEIQVLKGDRRSIGGKYTIDTDFSEHTIQLAKNDFIYLSTDGLVDQNAPNRKKIGTSRLISFLNSIKHLSADEQKQMIENELDNHQDNEPQRDDITFIGLKF